ncbi:copper-binding protein [Paraburkholderia strydomiana]|jgi:Cu/Ag efflux protein CusF|uniref:copper-binding protein n=1 Tax=Paraburkholderia strydomiana TaxID=1245417 RepID=UPI0038BDE278
MSQYSTRVSRFGVVAAVTLAGLVLFQPAFSQDASFQKSGQPADAGALRHLQARITGVDLSHNSVTLRDTRGEMAVIEVSPDVTALKEFQLGDTVKIAYKNAILTHVAKSASSGIRERIETEVVQPRQDGEASSTQSVELLATVLKIDRKKRLVTLRGPTLTEEFDVAPDCSLDGLKIGDSVRAKFVSVRATSVERVGTAPQ